MKSLPNNFLANGLHLSNVFHTESHNSVIEWLMREASYVNCPVQASAQAGWPTPDCRGLCKIRVQIPSIIESPQPLWTSHGRVEAVSFCVYSS